MWRVSFFLCGTFQSPANFISLWTLYRIIHSIQCPKITWLRISIPSNSTKPRVKESLSNVNLSRNSYVGQDLYVHTFISPLCVISLRFAQAMKYGDNCTQMFAYSFLLPCLRKWQCVYDQECAGGVIYRNSEWKIGEPSLISGGLRYIHLRVNILGKTVNSFPISSLELNRRICIWKKYCYLKNAFNIHP